MTPSPLTLLQEEAVAALVERARLTTSPVDVAKAQRFLVMAEAALEELAHIRTQSVRYDVAYNAAHDIGEGLLAAYGVRPWPACHRRPVPRGDLSRHRRRDSSAGMRHPPQHPQPASLRRQADRYRGVQLRHQDRHSTTCPGPQSD